MDGGQLRKSKERSQRFFGVLEKAEPVAVIGRGYFYPMRAHPGRSYANAPDLRDTVELCIQQAIAATLCFTYRSSQAARWREGQR